MPSYDAGKLVVEVEPAGGWWFRRSIVDELKDNSSRGIEVSHVASEGMLWNPNSLLNLPIG